MSSLGTINWSDHDWEVIAFIGQRPDVSMRVGPSRSQRPEDIIQDWLDRGDNDAYGLLWHLEENGYYVLAGREDEA